MNHWALLAIAVVGETVATSALKASEGFTKLGPSAIVVVGYAVAFYFLALTLKTIPIGVAYAVWSGAGIVLISAIAWVVGGQKLDAAAIVGMSLIVAGVVVINTMSSVKGH